MARAAAKPSYPGKTAPQPFWELMRDSKCVFETTVKGTSMEPTIPDGTRVRIRASDAAALQVGEVVACVSKGALFAHRVVHFRPRGPGGPCVITRGDNLALCDPPTRASEVLGRVTEIESAEGWRAPGPQPGLPLAMRGISAAHRAMIRAFLALHFEVARRVAGTSLILGVRVRRARVAMLGP
jgi:hypothetical protein